MLNIEVEEAKEGSLGGLKVIENEGELVVDLNTD